MGRSCLERPLLRIVVLNDSFPRPNEVVRYAHTILWLVTNKISPPPHSSPGGRALLQAQLIVQACFGLIRGEHVEQDRE